jgi:hypothetical protein
MEIPSTRPKQVLGEDELISSFEPIATASSHLSTCNFALDGILRLFVRSNSDRFSLHYQNILIVSRVLPVEIRAVISINPTSEASVHEGSVIRYARVLLCEAD